VSPPSCHERLLFTTPLFQVETNLPPVALLQVLKRIEAHVGRVPSIRNGPRAIDLDIIIYDNQVIDTRPLDSRTHPENLDNQLIVPHPRVSEREFVLRPLNELVALTPYSSEPYPLTFPLRTA